MQSSRRLLLYGLYFFLHCCPVRGTVFVPDKASNFTKCDPSQNQCPTDSFCEQSNNGYYCICSQYSYNEKDKTSVVYPGGECLGLCDTKGNISLCACRRDGFVAKLNYKGLYACTDKCRNDSDCPARASCHSQACHCNDICTGQINCVTLVKLDEVCAVPSTTTSPLLTSYRTMGGVRTVFPTTQPGYDRCHSESSTDQELEKCEKYNSTDPLCVFLKSIENITENACEKNKTNTSVEKVATQTTNLLNQTSLKTFNSTELQTLFIAVIEKVETSLLTSFATDPRDLQINNAEITAEMKVSDEHCDRGSSIILEVDKNNMQVPCSLVNFNGGGAIFISYKGLNARLNGSILASFGDSDNRSREEIISSVVSGAITSDKTQNLSSPVRFTLKHMMDVKPHYPTRCVFWDSKVWSTQGCETRQSEQENSTLCLCTHLSTFAVIMAPTPIEVDAGLRLISHIGLSISLVCLCLSFLTLILCRSLRSAHTSVLTVLCGCLFLGQFLVLVGLQQTQNKILCAVIAGSLQFLFLCAFCWMTLESVLLFLTVRNLQALNYMNSQRSNFPFVCLIGFGIPVIITIISVLLYPDRYGGETHCWLKISHVWSFLGPVCMFISANFVLLVLTFWLLKKKLSSLNTNVSTLTHTRLLTFKALSQLFILGCTWIIGLFQFGSESLVASYIFTICNSLQGVYIFVVHCLLNRQVREEYNRVFRRLYSKKSTSDTMTGSTVPMTIKSSQVFAASKEDDVRNMEKKC
ncbi:adhesion G protein-coupled receptor E3-like isoform X2 [Dendrobates tinctorius]|uniref:adhesion G protein-coupled receptor E3-like isoform X2 n=1 Tax=Dendrobates tinctorius TaxID=92724 RepID=UPI003CCA198C